MARPPLTTEIASAVESVPEGDFTFVTNNAKDFRRLYAREEVHAGLMILIPNAPPTEQRILFDAALDELGPLMTAYGVANEQFAARDAEFGIAHKAAVDSTDVVRVGALPKIGCMSS